MKVLLVFTLTIFFSFNLFAESALNDPLAIKDMHTNPAKVRRGPAVAPEDMETLSEAADCIECQIHEDQKEAPISQEEIRESQINIRKIIFELNPNPQD